MDIEKSKNLARWTRVVEREHSKGERVGGLAGRCGEQGVCVPLAVWATLLEREVGGRV